jgi:hypothetical protein
MAWMAHRMVNYWLIDIPIRRGITPRPVGCNDHLINSHQRIQGRSDTFTSSKQHQSPITNNKHMINQQVSLENSYWKKKFAGASSNSHQKMQKLARDKQEINKTRR